MIDLKKLYSNFENSISSSSNILELEETRVSILGKKGEITKLLKSLSQVSNEEKKVLGKSLNKLKDDIIKKIDLKRIDLTDTELNLRLTSEALDITLPIRPSQNGRIHPISQTIDEIVTILGGMGMTVKEGPNIEDDWHNFTALNIPIDHPARQEHDTFYFQGPIEKRKVLRTHKKTYSITIGMRAINPRLPKKSSVAC